MICQGCGCEYVQWGGAFDVFYCQPCHAKEFARSQRAICLICQERKLQFDFVDHHQDYVLRRDGHNIYLYCRSCEEAFLALPASHQTFSIQSRCNLVFPRGQVIYGLIDPESHLVRNVGRTHLPTKRLGQHLRERHNRIVTVGEDEKPWYTKANWMYDLHMKGLRPTMEIFREVEVAPLVIEWEKRYILYGLQQGWPLVNHEASSEELVARARSSQLDFLRCSFESLVRERFAHDKGIEAFVRTFYRQ